MKKIVLLCIIIVAAICMLQCIDQSGNTGGNTPQDSTVVTPLPFPDPKIPGFKFPEDSTTINKWLDTYDSSDIALHGWGIWAGLTTRTGNKIDSEDLYVFQTWETPSDLQDSLNLGGHANRVALTAPQNTRKALRAPKQLEHSEKATNIFMLKQRSMPANKTPLKVVCYPAKKEGVYTDFDAVAYDNPAADHILSYRLYDSSVLAKMYSGGKTDIPDFPNTAIATKPRYYVVHKADIKAGFFPLRIWNGPNYCKKGFPQKEWPGLVYIDVNNKSAGDGSTGMNDAPQKPAYSYNLNTFIYYTIKASDTAAIHAAGDPNVTPGDLAILVGMHVTSREIKRWTWQTYWWTPNPNQPPAPSSAFIVSKRPAQITGAAAHYAMAVAYTFIWPNQPYTGGNNKGESIIAFNPFLESAFGTGTFGGDTGLVISKSGPQYNIVGCQTNCMSCHALAIFTSTAPINNQPGNYIPDTYIDMVTNSNFKGALKLDFLWSIQASLLPK